MMFSSRGAKISTILNQALNHCILTPTWITTKHLLLNNLQASAACSRRPYSLISNSRSAFTHCLQNPNLLTVHQYNNRQRIQHSQVKGQYRSTHYNPSGLVLHIKNDDDAKKFCTQLWEEIRAGVAAENSVGERALENLEKLIQMLTDLKCDTRNIFGLISANPRIVNCSWEKMHNIVMFLNDLGVRSNRVVLILNNSAIWVSDVVKLSERVHFLRRVGVLEGDVQKLVTKCPKVLTLRKGKLKAVVNLLKHCRFTREQIVVVINDCPNILETNIDEIEYIFQYVYFRMGLTDQKQMVQAKLFRHSLQHVRQRHLFLLRLGLYETPNVRSRTSIVNPKLHVIIDTSLNRFCRMFKLASVDEFRIFCQELIEDNDVDDYSDDNSDGDYDDDSDSDRRRSYNRNER